MKRTFKTILGVTLLEIMLVLAVAAMVVVMSIKYYQSANIGQQATAAMEQVQAVASAADGIAQATSSYSQVTSANMLGVLGANGLKTPWNGTVNITSGTNSMAATFSNTPNAVCNQVVARFKANANFSFGSCAAGSGNMTFTYHQ